MREMKDSGIPWLGAIPEGWKIFRIKDTGYLYGGLTGKAGDDFATDDYSGKTMPYIPFTNIFNHSIISTDFFPRVKVEANEIQNLVNKGDILFLMSSEDFDGVGKPAIIEEQVENLGLNSFCKGLRITNPNLFPKYLFYAISSHIIRELIRQEAKGFIRINLRQDKLASCPILCPPLSEQKLIADYLDRKCGEIDELVLLQEKMIEELKSYKQSVITEAVTKGLNPNAPMKDSGIEWIGEIPEHWRNAKIQHLSTLQSGSNLTTEQIQPQGYYPVYGGNGLRGYYDSYNCDGTYVLIGRQGALCGNINYANGRFWATEHAVVCYPKEEYCTHWFGEMLRTMNLNQYSLSSAQPGLAVERIKALWLPVPPLSEQQAIADYLDEKCAEIDSLIALKQQKIEHLKEYKKSLIYEYVTGKKQVASADGNALPSA